MKEPDKIVEILIDKLLDVPILNMNRRGIMRTLIEEYTEIKLAERTLQFVEQITDYDKSCRK